MTRLEQQDVAPNHSSSDAAFEKRWAVWQAKVTASSVRQQQWARPLGALAAAAIAVGLLWALFLA